ncbi:ribosome-associated toxin RatA of RatAB toxin-antitoxin module [Arthrobacter globiformis]|uniref:SRPBCC family protein n=1 Tax=Arthrobacter globiformis TaxID=1665 RepID=UPI00277E4661|nr:SRPBCC family protein [Arthrobacter globiformis]MDQ1057473.1 ribosome-associated toxin RatA of RatAB toxin-antitoxin module [Arthrobacter globiformis]
MATVQESITVDVPVRQAYNQWTQFEDFPNFMSGVDAVRQLDDTTVHFETSIAGVKREYDAQITVQEPDQRVTWESLNEPRNAGTVWFESLGDNETKVNVELTWEPESAVEKLGAATGLDSRQVASDLRKFKKFIEERDTETGAWRESVSGGEVEGDAGTTAAGAGVGTGTGVGAGTPGPATTAGGVGAGAAGVGMGATAAGGNGDPGASTGYSEGAGMDAVPGRSYESGDAYDAAATERPVDADPDMAVDTPYGDNDTGEPRTETRHTDTRRDDIPDR